MSGDTTPDRWTGGSDAGCRHSPGPSAVIGRDLATGAGCGTRRIAAPGSCTRRSGSSSAMSGARARSSGRCGWERSGNHGRSQVRSAALFCSPVRCFICGSMEMAWWQACGCFPGGQGVAGSNPAVPTRRSRSEGVPGLHPGPFSIFGSQSGSHRESHVFVASVSARRAFGASAWPVSPGEWRPVRLRAGLMAAGVLLAPLGGAGQETASG
jgi:hypothetical protein